MKKIQIPNEEEKNQVEVNSSHVVILGAGASKAAFPQGDKNGRILPLMNDFIEVLDIEDLLTETKLLNHSNNFEEIYNELCKNSEYDDVRNEIETKIYEYFRRLELPNIPTVYDHLLLSLRKKDCIASFNWDPLLVS